MCGICGFTGKNNRELLRAMNESLRHRGPDDDGYYIDSGINMAMRRLSIVDLEKGKQPVSNEDESVWLVFNGEIYNHAELREVLQEKGHRFTSDHSDTEVIVHLYEEYKHEWPKYVNGMFAVAICDKKEKELSLYRDRIGKKPLYYAAYGNRLVFGSEIKALLKHPGISRAIDHGSICRYLALKNTSAPDTVYSSIKQLLPGEFLCWDGEKPETGIYWKVDFTVEMERISAEDAADELLGLLDDAVRIRMDCDVPYGAYLSGGVDSSSVVVLMNRSRSGQVKTFSLGYEDSPEGQFRGKSDDILYAKKISDILGTEHHEYIINHRDFADNMQSILGAFDEPFSGTVSTYFLSILIKDHVKVALSGDGADELFGSYLAHRLAFPIENYMNMKRIGKIEWNDLDDGERRGLYPFNDEKNFDVLRRTASDDMGEWRSRLDVFKYEERKMLLNRDFMANMDSGDKSFYSGILAGSTAKDALNRSLEIDQKELLPNQVLPFVDRLSMAHSVEVRSPYMDYRIIEFANKLPGNMKITGGINKYVHKKAMSKILPEVILNRPKEGFVQPIYSWMHGPLKSWIIENLELLPKRMVNVDYVDGLKDIFLAGSEDVNAKIWNLVCLSIWLKESEAVY